MPYTEMERDSFAACSLRLASNFGRHDPSVGCVKKEMPNIHAGLQRGKV